jgi:hypothetical protein
MEKLFALASDGATSSSQPHDEIHSMTAYLEYITTMMVAPWPLFAYNHFHSKDEVFI